MSRGRVRAINPTQPLSWNPFSGTHARFKSERADRKGILPMSLHAVAPVDSNVSEPRSLERSATTLRSIPPEFPDHFREQSAFRQLQQCDGSSQPHQIPRPARCRLGGLSLRWASAIRSSMSRSRSPVERLLNQFGFTRPIRDAIVGRSVGWPPTAFRTSALEISSGVVFVMSAITGNGRH
jgi:hypothetical protein